MRYSWQRLCLAVGLSILCLLLVFSPPIKADGGPILTDPQLWTGLGEGLQTAVMVPFAPGRK